MIEVKSKSKINVNWKVSPYDYSKETLNLIQSKFSKKYSIPKNKVTVVPNFIMLNGDEEQVSLRDDVIQDIQDSKFQLQLMKDWLALNNINDCDFELIKKIDADINARIDYQVYDKYHRYSVKWIKWDNFLSYGEGNYFDFSNLGHMVLLNSNPSNQGGKTTFCVDLIRFLLFGNISRYKTQDKYFNKHLASATNVIVEGCISIDNCDYVIKRTLSRPSLEKRTSKSKTTQKVEYYKVVGGDMEELEDCTQENFQDENVAKTNKVIKESIGNESDFDLIMSVTDTSLDELVKKKDTERGRLLSRWIGLLPLEDKDALAREKFNSEIKPYLMSNRYNEEDLSEEIRAMEIVNDSLLKENVKLDKENVTLRKELATLEETKNTLLSSKLKVDDSLLKIDIVTLNAKIDKSIEEGKRKSSEVSSIDEEIKRIGDVSFSVEEYDTVQEEYVNVKNGIAVTAERYKTTKANIEHLKSSEICPTCGRKLDNVDNSSKIKELEVELASIEDVGKSERKELNDLALKVGKLKENRELYTKKSQLEMKKTALELNLERLRNEYKEYKSTKREYELNSEAIDKNNDLDIRVRNTEAFINDKRNTIETNLEYIYRNDETIKTNNCQIEDRKKVIEKIREELKLVKNWKIYLDLVGKNGISKMVLRKTLPIINAKLSQLLSSVCDFDVEVAINDKNDVMFYLMKDGVRSDLQGASGFELTASALALRAVLADVSMIPRNTVLVLDELFGRVSADNFDSMKMLIESIGTSYDSIIIISHHSEIRDWCDTHIVVNKESNISTIEMEK